MMGIDCRTKNERKLNEAMFNCWSRTESCFHIHRGGERDVLGIQRWGFEREVSGLYEDTCHMVFVRHEWDKGFRGGILNDEATHRKPGDDG